MTDKRSQPCNRSYGSFLSRKYSDKANSYNPTLTPPPAKKKNPTIKKETEKKEKTFM